MPSFADYKRSFGGRTTGIQHTNIAKSVVESSWYDDPSSTVAYFYAYEYDDELNDCKNLHPEKSKTKIPMDIKYITNSYQSLNKDTVDHRIMFKPSCERTVPYYDKLFGKRCNNIEFPLGMYCDIQDENGIWRKWLVVAEANTDNRDFPNWSILPCTFRYSWVFKGKKYRMWGAPRSQSSYNFGEWESYKTSVPENQTKFVVPYNDVTATLFHNQRIIVSPEIEIPICWRVTKIEGINPFGLMNVTLYQDIYNPNTDVIERDIDGNWIAAWADLKGDGNLPIVQEEDPEAPPIETDGNYAEMTYTGTKPQLKINGGYKTITITYYNSGELLKDQEPGEWSYLIDDTDVSELVNVLTTDSPNVIKVKFLGDENYLHKVLTVKNTRSDASAELQFELISL